MLLLLTQAVHVQTPEEQCSLGSLRFVGDSRLELGLSTYSL